MAYIILDLGYTASAGIQYTATTDTSADWGDVDNETYFFDKETELVYFKDASGNVGSIYTSVGLTMPTAFSVANSPITQSGSLDVTANGVASQYIRGDGTLADFPHSTGGGSSVVYYFNGGTNQGTFGGSTYYEMSKTAVIGSQVTFQTIGVDGLLTQFITDALDPNLLEIPAGNWVFGTYFDSNNGTGNPSFYVELLKWNGTTFTSIADNSANPEFITKANGVDVYYSQLGVPQTSLLATDRLAIRFYVTTGGRTITFYTQGTTISQVTTTFSFGLTALNGLTDQVQYFQTGTSGTDFGISSSVDIHTFNLPVASATNTGKLSSTDWGTFNGKVSTGAITSSGLTMATSRLLGRTTASNGAVEEITIGTGLTLSAGTLTAVSSVGVWGISNSSGVYTFYATLTLAMASANAGQTIEMFADVTETSTVTVNLKNGVNINGNGHTYTLNNSGTNSCLIDNGVAVICDIIGITLKRIGGATSSFSNNSTLILTGASKINVISSTFYGSNSNVVILNNANVELNGANVYTDSAANGKTAIYIALGTLTNSKAVTNSNGYGSAIYLAGGRCFNCVGIANSAGNGIYNIGGLVENSVGNVFGGDNFCYGFFNQATAINCVGYSTTSVGFQDYLNAVSTKCVGYSTANIGFLTNTYGNSIEGCIGISSANIGFGVNNGSLQNCNGVSYANYGMQFTNGGDGSNNAINCTAYSSVSAALNVNVASGTPLFASNCTFWSGFNSASGHAVIVRQSGYSIVNCTLRTTAGTANCINGTVALTLKYAGNIYAGSTTPVNANVTQTVINTQDNQGNILI